MLFKKGVFKNFPKLSGKHLCWSLFLSKVAGIRPETSTQVFFCEFLHNNFGGCFCIVVFWSMNISFITFNNITHNQKDFWIEKNWSKNVGNVSMKTEVNFTKCSKLMSRLILKKVLFRLLLLLHRRRNRPHDLYLLPVNASLYTAQKNFSLYNKLYCY